MVVTKHLPLNKYVAKVLIVINQEEIICPRLQTGLP